MKTLLLTWLDRILIADVFFVIFAFFWFLIAVVGESTGIPLGYQIWQKLWMPLFNPAISILIFGAVSSWVIKKFSQWFTAKQEG